MDKKLDELTFFADDLTIFSIISKNYGNVGSIVYQYKIKTWCFLPKNDFFYKPYLLALVLNKINILNGYQKEIKK